MADAIISTNDLAKVLKPVAQGKGNEPAHMSDVAKHGKSTRLVRSRRLHIVVCGNRSNQCF
jgi:hypothetical protein